MLSLLSLLSFWIFLPVDLDFKVQRTPRLICWACVHLFCLFFSTAFAIGTKMKDSYTSDTVARVQKERVDRIAAVVETPCLIDRLVEFVADEKSNELLITEGNSFFSVFL